MFLLCTRDAKRDEQCGVVVVSHTAWGPGTISVSIFHVLPVSAWVLVHLYSSPTVQRYAFGEGQTWGPFKACGLAKTLSQFTVI